MRKIDLCQIEDIKRFVHEIQSVNADINIHKGSYVVDGKSLLGVMSLDLSKPVDVEIIGADEEAAELFNEICDRYE